MTVSLEMHVKRSCSLLSLVHEREDTRTPVNKSERLQINLSKLEPSCAYLVVTKGSLKVEKSAATAAMHAPSPPAFN